MRLLSFLSALESGLRLKGRISGSTLCARQVDYTNGNARMWLDDERAILVALFRMASGRSCLRVSLRKGDEFLLVHSLYPDVDDFSWPEAEDACVNMLAPLIETGTERRAANVVNA